MRLTTVILCAVLVVSACVSPVSVTKPGGDDAVVAFRQGGTARVELLAVSDSNLFFVRDNAVTRAELADVSRVRVEGYSLRKQKYVAVGCIGLASTAICVDMAFHSAWHFAAVTAMLCAAGTALLLRGEPQVDFRSPFDSGALEQLALYCRYPQGLTDVQWQELLRFYHQDTFLSSADLPKSRPCSRPRKTVLLDIIGRKVMGLQPGVNDVRSLAPGVYVVREREARTKAVRKVVVTS